MKLVVSYKDCAGVAYAFESDELAGDDEIYPWASVRGLACMYCGVTLSSHPYEIEQPIMTEDDYLALDQNILDIELHVCHHCGWWRRWTRPYDTRIPYMVHVNIGVARKYDVSSADVPVDDLRRYLRHHSQHLAHVNPFIFEQLMFECLRDRYGQDCEVVKVGGRQDKGIDILLIRHESEKTLVQVKRRADLATAEGVSVVRELNGVLFRERSVTGMVITTARSFTRQARAEAKIETVEKHKIELIAFDDVIDLIGVRNFENRYAPWEAYA